MFKNNEPSKYDAEKACADNQVPSADLKSRQAFSDIKTSIETFKHSYRVMLAQYNKKNGSNMSPKLFETTEGNLAAVLKKLNQLDPYTSTWFSNNRNEFNIIFNEIKKIRLRSDFTSELVELQEKFSKLYPQAGAGAEEAAAAKAREEARAKAREEAASAKAWEEARRQHAQTVEAERVRVAAEQAQAAERARAAAAPRRPHISDTPG